MFHYISTFLFVSFSVFYFTKGQSSDQLCIVTSNYSSRNSSGICKPFIECPSAIGLLHAGIAPKLCPSMEKGIVCCPDERRISAQKCDEYTNVLKDPIKANGALMYDGGYSNQDRTKDRSIKCEAFLTTFITGGRNAREREYPYQAAVGYGNEPDWRCGGTLISPEFVLTAGHCADTIYGPPTKVLLGDRKLSTKKDKSRLIVNVTEVLVHPSYKISLEYNDIALLKLSFPVELSRAVLPACLPDPADRLDRALGVEATGWGQTSSFSGQLSDMLQSTTLAKFNTSECSQFFKSEKMSKKRLPKGIIRSQFCAGDKHGYRDTCKGDSGGPVSVSKDNDNCVHYIVGITSFGSSLCGYKQPGVYTNILSYLDWIEAIVWYNITDAKNSKLYTKVGASNGELIVANPTGDESNVNTSTDQTKTETTAQATVVNTASINSETTTSTPLPASSTIQATQPTLSSSLQYILNEATTNFPSLTQVNDRDSYFGRISSSISSLLSNISIGR